MYYFLILVSWEIQTLTNMFMICCEIFLPYGGGGSNVYPNCKSQWRCKVQFHQSPSWETKEFTELTYWAWLKRYLQGFDTVVVLVKMIPNVPWRVALLGSLALLEEVCHSHFLLPVDLDVELSVLSPALCLPVSTILSVMLIIH